MNVATVVGARPQFIKAAAISRAIARRGDGLLSEILIHTGQHYDDALSGVFFRDLGLPLPAYNLGVGSGRHGTQTGAMLAGIEAILLDVKPDLVLVYGDTNSTLAAALAAAKLHVPVAHVEAGLRSFKRQMPEEINRVLTDHLATLLYCPSQQAAENLAREGIHAGVLVVGDVMQEVLDWQIARMEPVRSLEDELDIRAGGYAVATIHRAENTDDPQRLRAIFSALAQLDAEGLPVVVPLHPRTRQAMTAAEVPVGGVRLIPPVSYERMVALQAHARVILTDSGGVQKEAYWLGVPCVTLRDETEWTETVVAGWNTLASWQADRIVAAARQARHAESRPPLYGDGRAADHIVDHLLDWNSKGGSSDRVYLTR